MPDFAIPAASAIAARVRRLAPITEAIIVLGSSVGLFTLISFANLWQRNGHSTIALGDASLVMTVGLELALGIGLGLFLRARDWRLAHVSTALRTRDIPRGIGLAVLAYAAYALVALTLHALGSGLPSEAAKLRFAGQLSWPVVVLVTLVNPVFEELLLLGYTVTALKRYGVALACAASVGLRCLVHVYQGPLAVLAIAPVGIVFLVSYLRRGSLWPAVIAHAVVDAAGLSWIAYEGGAA